MTVRELIEKLSKLKPDKEIMILDSFNGGGLPREINLGPLSQKIKKSDANECADCEDLVGKTVYVIGYGCY